MSKGEYLIRLNMEEKTISWYAVLIKVCVCVVDINRSQVLQNIRVRSTLKKDGSWIQRSNDAKKEQDTAGYSQ